MGIVVYQRDTVKVIRTVTQTILVVLFVKLVNVLNGFHQMLVVAPYHNVIKMMIVLKTHTV